MTDAVIECLGLTQEEEKESFRLVSIIHARAREYNYCISSMKVTFKTGCRRGDQVVKRFGEPEGKGGHHVPVWLSYEQKGLQINFEGFSFEDRQNKITSVILYYKQ
ncbi:hypothetical protein GUITHDRAFT_146403 [Guillardia theta CCMP2712]|uniref:Uncharacterized protein n=1 Tax=Guillardia theta (strain CCMP2712) TaxID=905079 RepID=L1IH64_GUITC|nr:hypothetical protein GUITHDRAFT_146403 [Guillardia theta CCMP2712]EKX35578.1 hypothetical protein GUITHDRAFT_146403 [Guillardia theta CCMP2712]|eukprot:XP_005822558.1 hypothetical protein GUITHDRAFT_146403 [Guillardia theta CCMP2712]